MAKTPGSSRHKKSSSSKHRKASSSKHRKASSTSSKKSKSSTHVKATKAKRPPSKYNLFMKDELKRLKAKHGFVKGSGGGQPSFKEIFSEAASNWSK